MNEILKNFLKYSLLLILFKYFFYFLSLFIIIIVIKLKKKIVLIDEIFVKKSRSFSLELMNGNGNLHH